VRVEPAVQVEPAVLAVPVVARAAPVELEAGRRAARR
jgi:hypothetical protein